MKKRKGKELRTTCYFFNDCHHQCGIIGVSTYSQNEGKRYPFYLLEKEISAKLIPGPNLFLIRITHNGTYQFPAAMVAAFELLPQT